MTGNARPSGFTLIELMIVVAIIGILASVAIPEFGRLTMRSKQAERRYVMNTIKSGIQDLYVQFGDLPPDTGTHTIPDLYTGPWNPPLPAGSVKRMPDWTQPDWHKVLRGAGAVGHSASEIEGATYYSYAFWVLRGTAANPTQIYVGSEGDLDGDNDPSRYEYWYTRDPGGVFRMPADFPVGWVDAGATDGKF